MPGIHGMPRIVLASATMADEQSNRRDQGQAAPPPNPGVSARRPGPVPPGASARQGAVQIPAPDASQRIPQAQVVTPVSSGTPRRQVSRPRGMSISTKVILAMAGLAAVIVAAMFIVVQIQTTKAVNRTVNSSGAGYVDLLGAVGQEYREGLTERRLLQQLALALDPAQAGNAAFQPVRERWTALVNGYAYGPTSSVYHPASNYTAFSQIIPDLEWMYVAERAEQFQVPATNRDALLGDGWGTAAKSRNRGPRQCRELNDANWKPAKPEQENSYARLINTMRPTPDVSKRRLADLAAQIVEANRQASVRRFETVVGGQDDAPVVGIRFDPGMSSLDFLDALESQAVGPAAGGQAGASRLVLAVGVGELVGSGAEQPAGRDGVTFREGYGSLGQDTVGVREYTSGALPGGGSIRVMLNARVVGEAQASAVAAIAVLSVVALLLALGVAFLVGRGLTKPVISLMGDVQAIAAGNFDHRPVIRTRDEVGTLAQLLTEMAESLRVAQELWRTSQAQAHDIDMAREIQENLLAKNVPVAEGYDISAYYSPSKEVGGDYYDFFMVDENRIGMVVADVSGKGIPGSMIMMMAKALITYQAIANHAGPKALFTTVNKFLARDIKRGMFVTSFYIELDVPKRIARVASAGHCPMLIFRESTQKAFSQNPGGLALGFDKEGALFERNMKEEAIQLLPGDRVMIYTDGITEAKSPAGEEFGELRVQQIMARCSGMSSKEFLVQLVRAIEAHAQTTVQGDDITVITFRVV